MDTNKIRLIPKAARGDVLALFKKAFPGKSFKQLSSEDWDKAYNYVLQRYGNEPSNVLQLIRDYHFAANAPQTVVKDITGRPLQVYHGGTSPSIRVFDINASKNASLTDTLDKRFYFTDRKGIAAQYAVDPEYKLALTIDHFLEGWGGLDQEALEMLSSRLKMPKEEIVRIIDDYAIGENFIRRKTNEEDFIYPVYLNIRKHVKHDLNGRPITYLSADQKASINSSPAAILDRVDETVSNQYGIVTSPTTDYLVQFPQQIKRSAAITYDEAGNIIPISLRDNFRNPDINYKSGGKLKFEQFK